MADKLISAEALLLSVRDDPEIDGKHFARIKEHINHAPDTVKHGRWIEDYETFIQDNGYESEPIHTGFVCSVCGRHSFAIEPYCHCGARMDGDNDG